MNPDAAMDYLTFVPERHRIWEARQAGTPGPWTTDPILAGRKFTNVFRVLDPGSQFVLTDLDSDNPLDTLARLFLYRYTNLPATWMHVREVLGRYPTYADIVEQERLVGIINVYRDAGAKVFSGAYVILPQPNRPGDKVAQAVELAARWTYLHGEDFLAMPRMPEGRFELLRSEYGVGRFMAMQILTDWGYTQHALYDDENTFIKPGPGCVKGAKALAPTWRVEQTLEWCREQVLALSDCPTVELSDYDGPRWRVPSLMDIQNTLCEFSKYHRFQQRATQPDAYRPAHPGPQPEPVLPPHW